MSKRQNKVRLNLSLSKTVEDELSREAARQKIYKNELVEKILKEYFNPMERETHERHTKMQLARLQSDLRAIHNMLCISLISDEEIVRTMYRLNPDVNMDVKGALHEAIKAKVAVGQESFVKRVLDSAVNNRPNILSALNIVKPPDES